LHTRFHIKNDFGKAVEKMHSTYISEVNTVGTKGGAQEIQFFRHGRGDRAEAGKSVGDPKLSQILVANQ
jgi:hypothetical protein